MHHSQLNDTQSTALTTGSVISHPKTGSDLNLYSQAGTSIGIAFIGIVSVILLLGWLAKRFSWKKNTDNLIDVKASYIISAKERIALIYVDNQLLVIGITSHQITLLHTINEERTQLLLAQTRNVKASLKNNVFQQILQSVLKSKKE